MAYIGKSPQVGNYVKLDAITTSSTNTYNLTQDSVAFVPESALHLLVSLNGVIQSPLSSFSVSGSTITFLPSSGTLSSSDTIDFILVLGNTLDIGTPSDSTVTNAKTNFVSTSSNAGLEIKGDGTSSGTTGTLQLNCSANSHGIKLASPAHSAGQSYTLTFPTTAPVADKVLQTDGSGNLSFGDGSVAGTGAFSARSTTSSWRAISNGSLVDFDNDANEDSFDTDSNYNTTTYKYTAPATGVYLFWYSLYVAEADSSNEFGFLLDNAKLDYKHGSDDKFSSLSGSSNDHIQNAFVVVPMTSGQTMAVVACADSDVYRPHSAWGGCRLK